jgi:hypothetical protein
VQYAVVRIVAGRVDFRIFVSSRHWGRILLAHLQHLQGGLQLHFATKSQHHVQNIKWVWLILLLKPSDSGSTGLFANLDIVRPFLTRNSSSTGMIFWISDHAIFSGLPIISYELVRVLNKTIPFAKSSSISKSLSFADIDRYKAVTEYRFDCRADLDPS